MNKTDEKALKAGIGYTIGNILIKGISFLSIPLFSRILGTSDFGVYNVFVSYETILFIVMGLGIHNSLRSANLEFLGTINRYVSAVSLVYITNFVLSIMAVLFFSNIAESMFELDSIYLFLLCINAFSNSILYLYNTYLSLNYEYKKFLIIAFFNTSGNIILSIILMFFVFKSDKLLGRILGTTTIIGVIAVVILICMYRVALPQLNFRYIKFSLKYSLPLVPHSISQVILAQFDRIMINTLINSAAAGIFSLAGIIKLILVIITESISTAWSTWFYEKIHAKDVASIQEKSLILIKGFSLLTISIMCLVPEIIFLLGGRDYVDAKYVAIPMVMDAFFLFIYNLVVQVEYYKKKTLYIMYSTIIISSINLVLNYIFILKYGFIAAAYTTLFSYFVFLIIHLVISKNQAGFYIIKLDKMGIYFSFVLTVALINIRFMDINYIRYIVFALTFIYILCYYRTLIKNNILTKMNLR